MMNISVRLSIINMVLLIMGGNVFKKTSASPVPAPDMADTVVSLAKEAGNKVWNIGMQGKEVVGAAPVSGFVNKMFSLAKEGSKKVGVKIRETILPAEPIGDSLVRAGRFFQKGLPFAKY